MRHSILWLAMALSFLQYSNAAKAARPTTSLSQLKEPGPAQIQVRQLKHASVVQASAFSPDSKYLATAATDHDFPLNVQKTGAILLWNVQAGEVEWKLPGFEPPPFAVAFAPDGKHLAVTSPEAGGMLKLIDLQTRKVKWSAKHQDMRDKWISYSPDSRWIATGGGDAFIWDAESGKLKYSSAVPGDVEHAAWSTDGKTLVLCSPQTMQVHFCDAATGKTKRKIDSKSDYAQWSALLPGGKTILYTGHRYRIIDEKKAFQFWTTGSGPLPFKRTDAFEVIGRISLTELDAWKPLRDIDLVEFDIDSSAVSADGKIVAVGGRTILGDPLRMAYVYDLTTGKTLLSYTDPEKFEWPLRYTQVALSPDGQHIAFVGQGKTMQLLTLPPR